MLLLFFGGIPITCWSLSGFEAFYFQLLDSTKCRLQTIVFRIKKQWDYCFLVLIAWWKQWSFVRTVLATKLPGSNFGQQWLSPLHCHGRYESIVFSCSFQTSTLLLNLISCRLQFNYSAFFPPKRSRRWNFGKGKASKHARKNIWPRKQ